MWAAFNETGDAAVVEEMLRLGADPHAANKAGETALTWAMRRGETPAVAALRKAGSSNSGEMRASVAKAVSLLQKSGSQFLRTSGCTSCHHQFLPQMALGVARRRGVSVDETAARQQVDATIALLKTVHEQALKNRDRIPDPPIGISYTLIGLAAENYRRDDITDAMSQVIAAWQSDDGALHTLPAMPRNNEERSMQVLGLAWAKAPARDIRDSVQALLAEQRLDGGWAQLPTLETDAYATGQALVALQTAGLDVASPEYRRGVAFLLRTQFPDGSWLVRSRTFPVQPLKDSGFPHGKHQWISAAGTSWATTALALALPVTSARASSGLD